MRTLLNTCGVVIILLSLVWFAMNNSQPVALCYYPDMRYEFPVWGLVLVPFLAGIVIGNVLDVLQRFRLKREIKKLRQVMHGKNSS